MKTITTKTAKNGAKLFYVEGKRVSREVALQVNSQNLIESLGSHAGEVKNFASETTKAVLITHLNSGDIFVEATSHSILFNSIENAFRAFKKIIDSNIKFHSMMVVLSAEDNNKTAIYADSFGTLTIDDKFISVYKTVSEAQIIAAEAEITKEQNSEAENKTNFYSAFILGHNDKSVSDYFSDSISAYKWICKKCKSSRNYADGAQSITFYGDNCSVIIFEHVAGCYFSCNDKALEDYINQREAEDHIKKSYSKIKNVVEYYMESYKLTVGQAEQLYIATYIEQGTRKTFDSLLDNFKKCNAVADNNKEVPAMKTIETTFATVKETVELIRRLNYRNDTFVYVGTTRDNNADIEYRHFDAFKQNGEQDSFGLIEIVVDGKLEVVRFFNLFRDITVDFKLGEFTPDYSDFGQVIDADDVPVFLAADSSNFGKPILLEWLGDPLDYLPVEDYAVNYEALVESADAEKVCAVVPAVDFKTKLAELKAAYDNAVAELAAANIALDKAQEAVRAARDKEFLARIKLEEAEKVVAASEKTVNPFNDNNLVPRTKLSDPNIYEYRFGDEVVTLDKAGRFVEVFSVKYGAGLTADGKFFYRNKSDYPDALWKSKKNFCDEEVFFKIMKLRGAVVPESPSESPAVEVPPKPENISDSLFRAMKIALEKIQESCRDKNIPAALNEIELYNICRNALNKKEVA